jgi:hypothetical protein
VSKWCVSDLSAWELVSLKQHGRRAGEITRYHSVVNSGRAAPRHTKSAQPELDVCWNRPNNDNTYRPSADATNPSPSARARTHRTRMPSRTHGRTDGGPETRQGTLALRSPAQRLSCCTGRRTSSQSRHQSVTISPGQNSVRMCERNSEQWYRGCGGRGQVGGNRAGNSVQCR